MFAAAVVGVVFVLAACTDGQPGDVTPSATATAPATASAVAGQPTGTGSGRPPSPGPTASATAAISSPTPRPASTVPPVASSPPVTATATAPPSGTGTPPATAPPEAKLVTGGPPAGLVLERAPIESLELRVAESLPPQHFVDVTSGLPNGCARFYGYELARTGDTITVTIWNTMPADIRAACTMLYGYATHAVPLGSTLVPGRQYTLRVNDRDTTFVAR